ncbi:MAG: DUF559 domain-containing protein [Terricaulis sp.]
MGAPPRSPPERLGLRRQAPLGQFVIDFLCHDPPVAVEVDGPLHREPARAASDAERDRIVTALGYVVVRIDEALVRGESRLPEEMITAAGMNARAAK